MTYLSLTDLENGKQDVDHISEVATSLALTATDRLGTTKQTVSGAIARIAAFNIIGPWTTATAYNVKDVVQVIASGVSTWYVAIQNHISSTVFFDDQAANWRVFQGLTLADLASFTLANSIGYQGPWSGSVGRNIGAKLAEIPSVFDFIPVSLQAAIVARASTVDVIDYINAAIAAYPIVLVPPGGYRTSRPINFSARRIGLTGRRLIGAGADQVQIDAYTGVYPCIDATGQSTGEISGINFRSDNPPAGLSAADCASIGLMQGRGNVSISCNQLVLRDLRFNLASDMTRNAGNGTVGILNNGAEHVIRNGIQIYANLPVADHNGLQFTPAFSSAIPTYGAQYEQVYGGSPISCTIHESRNMQLIALDSFRAIWLHQAANSEWPNLYTSTRKRVSTTTTPAQKESFYLTGSCSNVLMRVYQEVSGLFGSTYRMDHRYITHDGLNENIDITVQRAVGDYGFTAPSTPEPSVMALANSMLANSRINCNYTIGGYQNSGDNLGLAALPVAFAGTPVSWKNVEFTLDHSGSHSADIFASIGQYCTDVISKNYYSGDDYYGYGSGAFVPVATGLVSAGVGTYSFRAGAYSRSGKLVQFTISMAWSAHSGTGGLAITGLPFASDVNLTQAVSIAYDTLVVGVGKQCVAEIPNGQAIVLLNACDPAGGAKTGVQVDGTVASLTISGSYKIA